MNTLIRFKYKRLLRSYKSIRDKLKIHGISYTKKALLDSVYFHVLLNIYDMKEGI